MKKIIIIVLIVISAICVYGQNEKYYWYKGEKVFLKENKAKKFLLLKDIESEDELNQLIGNLWHIEKLKKEKTAATLNNYNKKNTQENFNWAFVKSKDKEDKTIKDMEEIVYQTSFFKNSYNQDIGLSHLFYVKLKKEDDLKILEELCIKHSIEIIGSNKFMPLWYTLSCSKYSSGDALAMANFFYETNLFSAAEPDLMVDDLLQCVDDPLFNDQWNLENIGQSGGDFDIDIDVCNAWELTMGWHNVIVAVLDHGIEDHPDLLNISPLSYDTESATSPSLVLGNHGTACAGIIGASTNNDLGIAGIAPNCQLMSISNSLESSPNSRQRRADGINFAWENGAAVISNSWGSTVQYQLIDDAINFALTEGRNGLGCVVVFASGNDNNGTVNYPANCNSDIIAVGAMSMCGERKSPTSCDGESWWGSNYGPTLDVIAPGVLIPTTDIPGGLGYNESLGTDGDYFNEFNGTSSATPQVAGIAALILSVRPDLTQDQVRNAIESSCDKVGTYSYTTTSGRTNGTWVDQVGYGKVNAHTALLSVLPTISGPSTVCLFPNSTYTINLPPGTSVNWTGSKALRIVSGQGTPSVICQATRNGATELSAVVTLSTGETIDLEKEIFVGTLEPAILLCPASEYPIFSTHLQYGYVNEDYYLYAYGTNLSNNDADYKWRFYSSDPYELPVLGQGRQIEFSKSTPGDYTVSLQYNGVCGWSDETFRTITIEYNVAFGLLMAPNPATEETTLSIESVGTIAYDEDELWEVEIYSSSMILKVKKNKIRGKEVKIKTNGWKTGIYFVSVKYKDLILQDKLVIK